MARQENGVRIFVRTPLGCYLLHRLSGLVHLFVRFLPVLFDSVVQPGLPLQVLVLPPCVLVVVHGCPLLHFGASLFANVAVEPIRETDKASKIEHVTRDIGASSILRST
jgi:hypothetical protein